MKKLACEMCGGELIKDNGVFVCQSCGCKYSVEEAKKMMVEGVIQIDNTPMIENYLTMAENAYESSNNSEAESYCNKIIEIDPKNYKAWALKGKAAGWSSTLGNIRFSESVSAFSKALQNCPENEKNDLTLEYKEEIKRLALALIRVRAGNFEKWPDNDNTNGLLSDLTTIINAMVQFINQAGVVIEISEMMSPIATQINQSIVEAWQNVILPEYKGDEGKPSDYDFTKFLDRIGYCTTLLEKAIDLCDDDEEDDVQRYKNLVFLHEQALHGCSWDYEFTDWGKKWYVNKTLTNEAKDIRIKKIVQYKSILDEIQRKKDAKIAAEKAAREKIEKEIAEKRFKEYWESHTKEKEELEIELRELKSKIHEYTNEIQKLSDQKEIYAFNQKIDALLKEKNALGIFKIKEKKAIQNKIDDETSKMNEAKKKMNDDINAIQRKIDTLKSRISEINRELTKPR